MTGIFTPAYSVSKRTGSDGQRTERLLGTKARLVTAATVVLAVAVVIIVVGSILSRGGADESGSCRGDGRSAVAGAASD
jgi:hypothetical protein